MIINELRSKSLQQLIQKQIIQNKLYVEWYYDIDGKT